MTIQAMSSMFPVVFMCFFTLFAIGWMGEGGQTGLVHNLLMQFFNLYSSKIKVSETFFFAILIT